MTGRARRGTEWADIPPSAETWSLSAPANDNEVLDDLPLRLAVTQDEVRLLQRYLGPRILALFE